VGLFDEENWGKGYAEENDFSLRAARSGWRNVLSGNVFVEHIGAVSFAENTGEAITKNLQKLNAIYPDYDASIQSFIQKDPPRVLRNNVAIELLCDEVNSAKGGKDINGKSILFVSHTLGGGTQNAVDSLTARLVEEGQTVFILNSPVIGFWELHSQATNVVIKYRFPQ
jgi:hypothetical protein